MSGQLSLVRKPPPPARTVWLAFALACESAPLRRRLSRRGALHLWPDDGLRGQFLHLGIGAGGLAAGPNPEADLTSEDRPVALVIAGTCAGLAEPAGTGRAVLARNWSDPEILTHARAVWPDVPHVEMTHTSLLLATPRDKTQLRRATGAIAADMESATMAAWAKARGLPVLCLRVVSDGPEEILPAVIQHWSRQVPGARWRRSWMMLQGLRPAHGREVFGFARRAQRALRSLATLLEVGLPQVVSRL